MRDWQVAAYSCLEDWIQNKGWTHRVALFVSVYASPRGALGSGIQGYSVWLYLEG